MPASKSKQFTTEEQQLAMLGRAMSHPARVRILSILSENDCTTNRDLIPELKLSKTAIQNHVKKMEEADLVKIEYLMNCFSISKSKSAGTKIAHYLKRIKNQT